MAFDFSEAGLSAKSNILEPGYQEGLRLVANDDYQRSDAGGRGQAWGSENTAEGVAKAAMNRAQSTTLRDVQGFVACISHSKIDIAEG